MLARDGEATKENERAAVAEAHPVALEAPVAVGLPLLMGDSDASKLPEKLAEGDGEVLLAPVALLPDEGEVVALGPLTSRVREGSSPLGETEALLLISLE